MENFFFDGTDWGNERFGVIMDDVIVTGKGVEGLSPIARADWERFHIDLLPKIQHDTWEMEKNILMPIAAVTAAPIVAGELLGFAGTSSLFETPTEVWSEVETTYETDEVFYEITEWSESVTIDGYFNLGHKTLTYGKAALDTTVYSTSRASVILQIPKFWKYVIAGGSSAAVIYSELKSKIKPLPMPHNLIIP